jgi:hypothetical protein
MNVLSVEMYVRWHRDHTVLACISIKMPLTAYSPLLVGNLPPILPPMLRSNIPGSWAYDTMSQRIANDILPRIIDDNKDELTIPTSPLRSDCFAQLNDLKSNLESGKYGYLTAIYDQGPDLLYWENVLNSIPSEERNWLDAPWIITEYYFYRRIASVFKFFETGYDMFIPQKIAGLVSALPSINDISSRIENIFNTASPVDALTLGVQTSLWGNKIDLSLWPAARQGGSQSTSPGTNQAGKISSSELLKETLPFILDDHTTEVVNYLLNLPSSSRKMIGIVVDNAGYELFSDMLLGHILLALNVAEKIVFHTKGHPTFVSDATMNDCLGTIDLLQNAEAASPDTKRLADSWMGHYEQGKFQFINDLFWCQPTAFWDMPADIQAKVSTSDLIFVKGDANYRRLLGERDWPLDTSAKMILSYWPVPVCALRTFKAEIGCGISVDAQRRAENADKNWKVSGRWGVVQFGGTVKPNYR